MSPVCSPEHTHTQKGEKEGRSALSVCLRRAEVGVLQEEEYWCCVCCVVWDLRVHEGTEGGE